MTEPRIAPEQLAALLDGTLSREERDGLLGELANSPEDVALLLESAANADAAGATAVVPLGSRRRWGWWGLATAAAVMSVVAVSVFRRPVEPAVLVLAAQLEGRVPQGDEWVEVPWVVTRGADQGGGDPVLAFQVGVRLVDLEVAARGGQAALAARIAGDVSRLLAGTPGGAPFAARLRSLEGPHTPRERRSVITETAALFDGSAWLEAGAWLRAAHLAALLRDDAFFETGSVATARLHPLVAGLEDTPAGRDARLTAELRGLRGRLALGEPLDWSALSELLFHLLGEGPP